MTPATVHLTIDRLVLDAPDLAPADVPRLVAALEHELTALLTAQASGLSSSSATPRLRAPDLSPETPRDPAGLGRALARSLARSLGGAP